MADEQQCSNLRAHNPHSWPSRDWSARPHYCAGVTARQAAHVQPDEGAPRQAGTATRADAVEQVRHDLERLGVATGVRALTPASAGHAVRLIVGDGSSVGVLHLEPQQAADLAHQLLDDARDAIQADRAVRRG